MSTELADHILQALQRRQPQAAFVSEVAATVGPAPDPRQIEEALRDLRQKRKILVADHAAPDIHLATADLRIVAHVPAEADERVAFEAAEDLWNTWLRAFLSTHRCQ